MPNPVLKRSYREEIYRRSTLEALSFTEEHEPEEKSKRSRKEIKPNKSGRKKENTKYNVRMFFDTEAQEDNKKRENYSEDEDEYEKDSFIASEGEVPEDDSLASVLCIKAWM